MYADRTLNIDLNITLRGILSTKKSLKSFSAGGVEPAPLPISLPSQHLQHFGLGIFGALINQCVFGPTNCKSCAATAINVSRWKHVRRLMYLSFVLRSGAIVSLRGVIVSRSLVMSHNFSSVSMPHPQLIQLGTCYWHCLPCRSSAICSVNFLCAADNPCPPLPLLQDIRNQI